MPVRLPAVETWTLIERMAQEKEAYGFYFSAHPVERYTHLAKAHGARSFAEICSLPAPADGGRSASVMAGLVEEARWRTSAKGRRYLMASCSDASGGFFATVFEDEVAAVVEDAAKNGGCGLLTVELDRRPGDETPRVTIKRVQPFESLSQRTRLKLEVKADDPAALFALAALLADHRGGNGQLSLRAPLPGGGHADLLLGRDFALDAECAARVERVPGVTGVRLGTAEGPKLALVG